MGDNFKTKFLKFASIGVLYLGITSVNSALIAAGSPLSIKPTTNEKLYTEAPISQSAEIVITSGGYTPNYIRVSKDSPVTIKLVSKDAYSCASAFRIPSLGISKNLQANETYTFTFTPEKAGKIVFSCSMGMYTGVIEVL